MASVTTAMDMAWVATADMATTDMPTDTVVVWVGYL